MDDGQELARSAPAPLTLRAITKLVDVLVVLLVFGAAISLVRGLRPHLGLLALVGATAVIARAVPGLMIVPPLVLAFGLAWRRRSLLLAVAAALIGTVVIVVLDRPIGISNALNAVLLRSAGDDWLTYESYARALLERASQWGGEDVFVYSPGMR